MRRRHRLVAVRINAAPGTAALQAASRTSNG
jgi:hypothetical protein